MKKFKMILHSFLLDIVKTERDTKRSLRRLLCHVMSPKYPTPNLYLRPLARKLGQNNQHAPKWPR